MSEINALLPVGSRAFKAVAEAIDTVTVGIGTSGTGVKATLKGTPTPSESKTFQRAVVSALEVATRLFGLGAHVTVTDPQAIANARRVHPQLTYVADRDTALAGAHAVIVVTEWDEYRREMDPVATASLVSGRVIVDGRNCLDPAAWRGAGWEYYGMGRP